MTERAWNVSDAKILLDAAERQIPGDIARAAGPRRNMYGNVAAVLDRWLTQGRSDLTAKDRVELRDLLLDELYARGALVPDASMPSHRYQGPIGDLRRTRENPLPATKIQSLVFDRALFSEAQARAWARNHGFDQLDVDEKTNTLRLRQRRPSALEGLRTITLAEGVKAVVGKRPELHAHANPAPHFVVWVPSAAGFVDEHGGCCASLADAAVTHAHGDAEEMARMHDGQVLGYDEAEGGVRANPSKFKWRVGQPVVYTVAPGEEAAIPGTWKGVIVSREPNIDDGLYYNVRWTTPAGETHEGLYHESDLSGLQVPRERDNPGGDVDGGSGRPMTRVDRPPGWFRVARTLTPQIQKGAPARLLTWMAKGADERLFEATVEDPAGHTAIVSLPTWDLVEPNSESGDVAYRQARDELRTNPRIRQRVTVQTKTTRVVTKSAPRAVRANPLGVGGSRAWDLVERETTRAGAVRVIGAMSDSEAIDVCKWNDKNGDWDDLQGSEARRIILEWWEQEQPRSNPSAASIVLEASARAAFVSEWGTQEEEEGRSHSGRDLMDVAPPTSAAADGWARSLWESIRLANPELAPLRSASLEPVIDALWKATARKDGIAVDDEEQARLFGHYVAMQAMGHGAAWADDHSDIDFKIPHKEAYGLLGDRLGRANPSAPPATVTAGDVELSLVRWARVPDAARRAFTQRGAPDDIVVKADAPRFTMYAEIDADGTIRWPDARKLSAAAKDATIGLLVGPPWSTANTRVGRWEERDRLVIRLCDARDRPIFEASDDDARDLFSDGFLDAHDLHGSLVAYANEHGLRAHGDRSGGR